MLAAVGVSQAAEWIVYEKGGKIWKIRSDGTGSPVQLTFPGQNQSDTSPSVCPGGHRIVFQRAGDIYKITQNGGETPAPVNLTYNTESLDSDPDCGTDGETNYVVFHSNRGQGHAIWRMNLTNGGDLEELTDNGEQPTICGTDRVVFMRVDGSDHDLFSMDLDDDGDTNLEQLISNSEQEEHPACRPDGELIAFVRYDPSVPHDTDIIEFNVLNSSQVELTDEGGGLDYYPSYSADGTSIAFTRVFALSEIPDQVYKQVAQPGYTATQLTSGSPLATFPDWAELAP